MLYDPEMLEPDAPLEEEGGNAFAALWYALLAFAAADGCKPVLDRIVVRISMAGDPNTRGTHLSNGDRERPSGAGSVSH